MDEKKQEYPKFTPTVKTIKISSPFVNKTEGTKNTVKFECTGVTHKTGNIDEITEEFEMRSLRMQNTRKEEIKE